MSQFVADFESYMPDEFDGKPYGPAGLLANADEAGIDVSVVFQGGVPDDPRPGNAAVLDAVEGEPRILPGLSGQSDDGAGRAGGPGELCGGEGRAR